MLAVLEWMVWTTGTAMFVGGVVAFLATITVLSIVVPSIPRKGFLPVETARGDRIYVSLLGSGLVMILFIVLTDLPLPIGALLALVAWVGPVMKWG